MIIKRWEAQKYPTVEQIKQMFNLEDCPFKEIVLEPGTETTLCSHPYHEIITILSGKMIVNVAGNKLLLRAGDRVEIPPNTKNSSSIPEGQRCHFLHAQKI